MSLGRILSVAVNFVLVGITLSLMVLCITWGAWLSVGILAVVGVIVTFAGISALLYPTRDDLAKQSA